MTTLQSIQARIAKLQAQAESLATTKSSAVLEKIRGLMDKHAVTVADIEAFIGKRRGRKPGKTVAAKQGPSAAKYRNPKTGATWSGHGRAPAWIANAKDRTRFLIAGAAPKSAAAVAVRAPKAGNYVRGPQPPKYRDPKTGATWSGRGIAPAWLAGAKDRSKFLIEKAEPAAKTARGPAAKKAAAKKNTATRKAAVKKVSVKAAASPARKAAPKNGAAAKLPVVRKARAPKLAVQSAPVEVAAPSAATEVASTAAAA
ncbi:H-NS family nucleoid-associated regulatory protein [Paraburkholderia silvatlantica]|uniref:DNA-binding protein H-NS n=1 Tax=Paraburkholderia silvatlantica TaxID=321895 RepID=A0ABR6FDW9_9BURK|nr:H-NS family nucleoid-associated regulatory protein [Paraburkholderia silvatlantica]MBB2925616.1 DNA-binding protein H-NS [Paraburkholderia silvatlantica]PVY33266.1 H-NS histone family protein [Paraburkholderia silvatlantica]PXW38158.1 H-NS histone family protein [Paraburkholderia silvatlantica]TDQ92687.1 H-NS histone family protein [Paraburkholderia silvatlantica]